MLTRFKEQSITVSQAAKMSPEDLEGKTTIGVLADRKIPISTEEYKKVRKRARKLKEKV